MLMLANSQSLLPEKKTWSNKFAFPEVYCISEIKITRKFKHIRVVS